ncbi:hypothetical protein TFLX_02592 [Thermoflexales bacterium]|nr:hypothetical protein TFLX_02592 [Thermoflexales bacterium]
MFVLFAVSNSARRARVVRLLLITILLASQLFPVFAPTAAARPVAGVLQTVGDFLSLGANTVRELQEALQVAGAEVRATLEQLMNDISTLIQTLSQTYQDNLNVTINSLDAATRNKLLELQGWIDQVNQTLQEDITLAGQTAKDVINKAGFEIRRAAQALEQSLKNVIVVGGETIAYVVDRAIYDAILVLSLILIGLGLLLFIVLVFKHKIPAGLPGVLIIAFMVIYLVLFGSLALIPSVRATAMAFTGVGLQQRLDKTSNQPHIVDVIPSKIVLGETQEIEIWGNALLPQGKSPTVKIAERSVPVSAASSQLIVVNVSTLNVPEGSTNLVLVYGEDDAIPAVVNIARITPTPAPPDLTLASFTVNPSSPVQRGNARATLVVVNQGQGPSQKFVVQWKPFAGHPGLSTSVPGLNAGQSQALTFDFAYPNAGTVDSVASVDVFNTVAETNEGNNSRTLQLSVRTAPPRQARITVTFTQITVHDDADPAASGELWLDFNISGRTGRWPTSGTKDVDSGKTYTINKSFQFVLTESEKLTVFVNGTDEDNPGFPTFDDHDPMGTVSNEFVSANEWGKGSHSRRSTCPDGCYTIHYTIAVTFLQ